MLIPHFLGEFCLNCPCLVLFEAPVSLAEGFERGSKMLGAAALPLLLAAAAAGAAEPTVRYDLRPDGVPVLLAPQTAASFDYPFKPFPTSFVEKAKATSVDWQLKGAVTPAKDQGAHGYCGTFGRVGAAEGQYAILSGHGLRNFSE
jgi:hypothetical protein